MTDSTRDPHDRRDDVPEDSQGDADHDGPDDRVTLNELAEACRMHPDLLVRLVTIGLIEPVHRDQEVWFERSAAGTVGRIIRLREGLGLNYAAIGVVLDLLDRIEVLEDEVTRLRRLVDEE